MNTNPLSNLFRRNPVSQYKYTGPVFGEFLKPIPPITNLPADTLKVRLRLRMGDYARAFVRTPGGVTVYQLQEENGGLKLLTPMGRNQTL